MLLPNTRSLKYTCVRACVCVSSFLQFGLNSLVCKVLGGFEGACLSPQLPAGGARAPRTAPGPACWLELGWRAERRCPGASRGERCDADQVWEGNFKKYLLLSIVTTLVKCFSKGKKRAPSRMNP